MYTKAYLTVLTPQTRVSKSGRWHTRVAVPLGAAAVTFVMSENTARELSSAMTKARHRGLGNEESRFSGSSLENARIIGDQLGLMLDEARRAEDAASE
jgi:hypothetical protein